MISRRPGRNRLRSLGILALLTGFTLVLTASLAQRGQASFTDQDTLTANNFTSAVSTGFKSPSATGDDYSQWTNPTNAFASDDNDALEDRNGQRQDWYNFSFSLPAGATIDRIEVTVEGEDPNWSGNGTDVELSWDGGASYTTTSYGATWPGGSEVTNTFGGGWVDTWGRTWSDAEFSDANFRVRLTKTGADFVGFNVDHIQVKVYYLP